MPAVGGRKIEPLRSAVPVLEDSSLERTTPRKLLVSRFTLAKRHGRLSSGLVRRSGKEWDGIHSDLIGGFAGL
jgi:hypothetical protein